MIGGVEGKGGGHVKGRPQFVIVFFLIAVVAWPKKLLHSKNNSNNRESWENAV